MPTPRELVRGMAAGRRDGTLAVPLALHVAARIQERDPEDFLFDATQLANALRDLAEAVDPDGVVLCDAATLLGEAFSLEALVKGEMLSCAVEATRRLRASYGDRLVLVASLPGPGALAERCGMPPTAAVDTVLEVGKEFLAAGADVLLVEDFLVPEQVLSTLVNVARFHQAIALGHGPVTHGLPAPTVRTISAPQPGAGLVITPAQLPRDTDIALLRDWVEVVRGPDGRR